MCVLKFKKMGIMTWVLQNKHNFGKTLPVRKLQGWDKVIKNTV